MVQIFDYLDAYVSNPVAHMMASVSLKVPSESIMPSLVT